MEQPLRPTAAAKRWMIATIILTVITTIVVAIYVTSILGAQVTTWLAPRLCQLSIYLLAMASAATAGRYVAEQTRAHIDWRVHEVAARMDRRMEAIGRCIGAKIEDTTGEIARVRTDVELDGYAKGYADGLARAPITATAKVTRINPR